jgi:probable rRNA maturation factor
VSNSNNLELEVQYAVTLPDLPTDTDFYLWVKQALSVKPRHRTELVIRIVDETEIALLNQQYSHKTGSTNVLSFSFTNIPNVPSDLIGDIVLCAPVIIKEAMEQNKTVYAHWAHITIHGVLHLIGYDHDTELTANEMENLERYILYQLGYNDPYLEV